MDFFQRTTTGILKECWFRKLFVNKKKKEDSDELEGEVSDLEEDASYESRRIRKYQLNQKKLFL